MIDHAPLGPGMIAGASLWKKHLREMLKARRDDVVVVSYPKAGRTWHRALFAQYVASAFLNTDVRRIDTRDLARRANLPLLGYTHDGANFLNAVGPRHFITADPTAWIGKRVVHLTRDPRDVLVSAYMHAHYRSDSFRGSLSGFIRHPFTGIEKILVANDRWRMWRRLAKHVLVQRYEDMHADPAGALIELLSFAKIKVDRDAASEAAEFSRFENMKRMEREGFFESKALRSGGAEADAMKVREGKVGGFSEHISAADLAFIDDAITRLGNPS